VPPHPCSDDALGRRILGAEQHALGGSPEAHVHGDKLRKLQRHAVHAHPDAELTNTRHYGVYNPYTSIIQHSQTKLIISLRLHYLTSGEMREAKRAPLQMVVVGYYPRPLLVQRLAGRHGCHNNAHRYT
jgi:hypothetical protein